MLLLDGGDLFGLRNEEMRNQTKFLCDETQKLGYKVFGLGEWDLNYGLDFLREMEKEHGFEFINANLRATPEGDLLFPPYVVLERAGLKIGVISVLSPSYKIITMSASSDEFIVDSPRDALDHYLPELRKKSDMIVLLSHLSGQETRDLLVDLGDDSGIDVAIEGHDARQYQRVNKVGNIYLLAANNQGKYIGQLDMLLSHEGKIQDATLTMHSLDKNSPEVAEVKKRVEAFKEKNKTLQDTQTSFVNERSHGDKSERFLGEHTCATCHRDVDQEWRTTAHSKAWNSLVVKGQTNNPDCVGCHVVGFEWVNGYDRVPDREVPGREALQNVQCEACHGYGTEHDRGGTWVAQARDTCTTCHDAANSPDFDYDTYWARIAH